MSLFIENEKGICLRAGCIATAHRKKTTSRGREPYLYRVIGSSTQDILLARELAKHYGFDVSSMAARFKNGNPLDWRKDNIAMIPANLARIGATLDPDKSPYDSFLQHDTRHGTYWVTCRNSIVHINRKVDTEAQARVLINDILESNSVLKLAIETIVALRKWEFQNDLDTTKELLALRSNNPE
jgi:hypothetical protein